MFTQTYRSRIPKALKKRFAAHMRRCPTPAEAKLWQALRGKRLGVVFYRQKLKRGYILDFYCTKKNVRLAVECDGPSHIGRKAYDRHRDCVMQRAGIKTLRFPNEAVLHRLPEVLAAIRSELARRGNISLICPAR